MHVGLALYKKQKIKQKKDNDTDDDTPTWGTRITKGERILLPVSLPKDEHWVLVVLYLDRIVNQVCIKVLDSMHRRFEYKHDRLIEAVTRLLYLMGGLGELFVTKVFQPIPLEQKLGFNFCGFHVLLRVWMEATKQVTKKIQHTHVESVRRYVQYMLLSKSIVCEEEKPEEHSEEDEFVLE